VDLERGAVLAGYEIGELLGRGGQSRVYSALDLGLCRTVAIKVLGEGIGGEEVARKRLLLEARTASALSHPGIATIYQVGEAAGVPFIAMEYVEGPTLLSLEAERRLPLAEALGLMRQMLEAVGHAHRKGVLHRDLKPGNVMVTPEGRVKLLDFGLAKVASEALRRQFRFSGALTESGTVVGTAPYVSPEQARDEELDPRSDLFSLGIVFHELLAGRHPFEQRTPFATIASILSDAPPPIPADRGVPPGIEAVVLRMLEKEPSRRPPSASEVLRELDEAALRAGLPVSSGALAADPTLTRSGDPAGIPAASTRELDVRAGERASGPARRRRLTIAAAAAAFVVLAAASIATWAWRRGAAVERPPDVVAVDPLEASGEPDVRNLAGLVTAQLAATLGRAPGLRVVLLPRSSSVSAEALERVRVGVRWTLQGTVYLSGEDVAVTLTMTEAPAGRVAWTATAKGRFDQILSLASRMASEAGGAAGSAVAAGRLDFPDRETFEDFVRADRALSAYDPAQLDTAVTLFSRCVERAPSFAPSYPRLGFSLLQYRNLGVDYDPVLLERAHAVIRKGLEIDPGNPQLVLALGWFRLYTYDFARAHEAVAQLAALPSGADLGCKLALWDEFYRGEPKAVTETLPRCRDRNPFDRSLDLNVVVLNAMLDRREEALAVSREFEATEPYAVLPVLARGWLSLAAGRAADAAKDVGESFRRRRDPIVGLLAAQAALVAGDPRASTEGFRAWLGKNPYSLEAHWLRCLAHELSGNEGEARAAAADALRWAGAIDGRHGNPTTRLFRLYFTVRAGAGAVDPEDVSAVDPSGQALLTAYLKRITLARLGRTEVLDGIPTPTSPTFWLNRFAPLEVERVRSAANPLRAPTPPA
jgi:predicted Ser/Thr protein kinase/TolB-like protein